MVVKLSEGRFDCWWADFRAGQKTTGRGPALPAHVDAVAILGRKEAESILTTGRLPKEISLLEQAGNLALLDQFFTRFCRRFDPMTVRSAHRRTPSTVQNRMRTRV